MLTECCPSNMTHCCRRQRRPSTQAIRIDRRAGNQSLHAAGTHAHEAQWFCICFPLYSGACTVPIPTIAISIALEIPFQVDDGASSMEKDCILFSLRFFDPRSCRDVISWAVGGLWLKINGAVGFGIATQSSRSSGMSCQLGMPECIFIYLEAS